MNKAIAEILALPGQPRMMVVGQKLLGIKEIKGPKDAPEIMAMAKALGIDAIYEHDEVAWCGLSQSYVAMEADKPLPGKQYDLLRALKWADWGVKVDVPEYGDVLVFKREGGGHVGMYVAETKDTYFVMGGNQGDAYSIVEIKKDRLYAARRYYATAPPAAVKRYYVDSTGKLSTNEA